MSAADWVFAAALVGVVLFHAWARTVTYATALFERSIDMDDRAMAAYDDGDREWGDALCRAADHNYARGLAIGRWMGLRPRKQPRINTTTKGFGT